MRSYYLALCNLKGCNQKAIQAAATKLLNRSQELGNESGLLAQLQNSPELAALYRLGIRGTNCSHRSVWATIGLDVKPLGVNSFLNQCWMGIFSEDPIADEV